MEETTRSVQKCSLINDPWDTLFTERVSLVLAKFFAKHNVKPNTVTLFSIISGVLGAICLCHHNIWVTIAGILLEILGAIFDCADGQVARMTHKGSRFGRFFDGFGDGVVYTSIYLAIAFRIMSDPITFTSTNWGWFAWLLIIPVGVYFHVRQARVADYYKQVHMFMIKNDHGSELEDSKQLEKEYPKSELSFFQRIITGSYINYTKTQERETPQTQKLLAKIRENHCEIPDKVAEMYRKNVRNAKALNLLVFNLRTYVLFALLIADYFTGLGLTAWIAVLNILILEPAAIILEVKWERLAKKALKEGFVEWNLNIN